MTTVNIILEGDGALKDWAEAADAMGIETLTLNADEDEMRAIYLRQGTLRGLPTVIIAARPAAGGGPVAMQMTLRMFLAIAAAFKARADYEGVDLR